MRTFLRPDPVEQAGNDLAQSMPRLLRGRSVVGQDPVQQDKPGAQLVQFVALSEIRTGCRRHHQAEHQCRHGRHQANPQVYGGPGVGAQVMLRQNRAEPDAHHGAAEDAREYDQADGKGTHWTLQNSGYMPPLM